MIPIVVSTLDPLAPHVQVCQASLEAYAAKDIDLFLTVGHLGSFGADYNEAMARAFKQYDEIIIANDDVVLNRDTVRLLMEDVAKFKEFYPKVGFVAARSDNVRPAQSILMGAQVQQVRAVSPIFAWISKAAFQDAQFPPINWFSDDVMCEDLNKLGYAHFVSRAYVHHAGSMTIGHSNGQHIEDALPWLRENRPEYLSLWFAPQEQPA